MFSSDKVKQSVGLDIAQICTNDFADPRANHCAHYVSHMLGLNFSVHCGELTGGRKERGNVRVQEIFEQCPKIGHWRDADLGRSQLIFVTRAENVDLGRKRMENIPNKHVGLYHDGLVHHYRNTKDEVGADTPEVFFDYFQKAYGPGQGLFFGWFPGEDLTLRVSLTGSGVSASKKFELAKTGPSVWSAKESKESGPFFVGREVHDAKRGYLGIGTGSKDASGPRFDPTEYESRLDAWAYLLWATGAGESNNYFNVVNTYDRAKFTFGFYQLAAHTPGDNLIMFFKRLAELPGFSDYFPELRIVEGRLARVDPNGSITNLEQPFPTGPRGEQQLQLFMNYLNPSRNAVEPQEVLHAARLIHWALSDPLARLAQVQVSAAILQSKMPRYARKLGLDGRSALECAAVADILHQGRGRFTEIAAALGQAKPLDALLRIGAADYPNRVKTLGKALEEVRGKLDGRIYIAATNDFRRQ